MLRSRRRTTSAARRTLFFFGLRRQKRRGEGLLVKFSSCLRRSWTALRCSASFLSHGTGVRGSAWVAISQSQRTVFISRSNTWSQPSTEAMFARGSDVSLDGRGGSPSSGCGFGLQHQWRPWSLQWSSTAVGGGGSITTSPFRVLAPAMLPGREGALGGAARGGARSSTFRTPFSTLSSRTVHRT